MGENRDAVLLAPAEMRRDEHDHRVVVVPEPGERRMVQGEQKRRPSSVARQSFEPRTIFGASDSRPEQERYGSEATEESTAAHPFPDRSPRLPRPSFQRPRAKGCP